MSRTPQRLRGWRRVATAMWPAPRDPQIYAQLELDAGPVLAFIHAARAAHVHLTPTHLVGRALASALRAAPELNVRLVGNRAVPRAACEVFFITALQSGGDDLSGVKVDVTADVFAVARALEAGVQQLRAGADRHFASSKRLMDHLPQSLLRVSLHLAALVTQRLQWDVPRLGLQHSPFGSAVVSSVGALGISQGYAPLSWLYDVPVLLLLGKISERACVRDGRVVALPILPLSVTIDHRYADGAQLSRALRALQAYLANPADYEPALPESVARPTTASGDAGQDDAHAASSEHDS